MPCIMRALKFQFKDSLTMFIDSIFLTLQLTDNVEKNLDRTLLTLDFITNHIFDEPTMLTALGYRSSGVAVADILQYALESSCLQTRALAIQVLGKIALRSEQAASTMWCLFEKILCYESPNIRVMMLKFLWDISFVHESIAKSSVVLLLSSFVNGTLAEEQ